MTTSLSKDGGPAKNGPTSIADRCALLDTAIEKARDKLSYIDSKPARERWQLQLETLLAIRRDVFLAEAYRKAEPTGIGARISMRVVQQELDSLYTLFSPAMGKAQAAAVKQKPIKSTRRPEPKWHSKIVKRRR